MVTRTEGGSPRHLDFVDWTCPSVTPTGNWIASQSNKGDPSKRLDIAVTIPPTTTGNDEEIAVDPFHQPLIVFLTGSANDHLQETPSVKKCPQQRYCRKPGLKWALQKYVIVSVAWDKSKRKGFNTGPPKSIIDLFAELECRFPNIYKRFLIGFSRGAMGVVDCQVSAPYFSALHVLIAPYYPSCDNYPERHPVRKVMQSYVDSRVDIWYIYGEEDEWVDEVENLRLKLCNHQLLRDHLLDEVMLQGMDHDSSFAYLMYNPGHLWRWLEQRIINIDIAFYPEEVARKMREGATMYRRCAAQLAEADRLNIQLKETLAAAHAQNHSAWGAHKPEADVVAARAQEELHAARVPAWDTTARAPEELPGREPAWDATARAPEELPGRVPAWDATARAPEELPGREPAWDATARAQEELPGRVPAWDATARAQEELPDRVPAWDATARAQVELPGRVPAWDAAGAGGRTVEEKDADDAEVYSDDGDEIFFQRDQYLCSAGTAEHSGDYSGFQQ